MNTPPSDPKVNAVWIDDAGELQYFDGKNWVPYLDVAGGDLQPLLVTKDDED